jgi:hypothetical protein
MNVSTASTRRCSCVVGPRPSFWKMLRTCFSTLGQDIALAPRQAVQRPAAFEYAPDDDRVEGRAAIRDALHGVHE